MSSKLLFIVTLALLLVATFSLGAFDFGGILDNATTLTYTGSLSFLQENKLALWFQTPLGRALTLSVKGSYTYSNERPYLFDIDSLKLEGKFPLQGAHASLISFTAGRFTLKDFSRLVLNDPMDGLQLEWHGARLNAALAAAYSGLELAPVSTVSMSWADFNSTSLLAPPRLVELLQIEFLELFARQDLLVALLAQQDLRPQAGLLQEGYTVEVSGQGGRLSTEYLGLALRGPLGASLYYDAFTYLGAGRTLSYIEGVYRYEWMLSALAGAGLRFFREQWLHSRMELRVLVASGDADSTGSFIEGNRQGLSTTFVTISQPDLALLFSPRLGNLALVTLSTSIKPIAVLQTGVTATLFLRPAIGLISDSRIDPASDSPYLGSEIDIKTELRPFSDLGAALGLGLFLPGGAFRTGEQNPEFRGKLEISLSF
jgi:hypothetical protein